MRYVPGGSAAVLLMLAGLATSLAAQQRGHQHQQGMHGQMQPGEHMMMMGRMGAFRPERLIEQKEELQLTDEQVRQLTTLQDETAATVTQARESHDTHRAQLMEAMAAGTPDRNTVLSHMEAAHAAMGTVHRTELQSLFQAMEILSDEQRETVRGSAGQGMHHGQGSRGGCCGGR